MSNASLSKAEIASEIAHIADGEGAAIALVSLPSDAFSNQRVLLTFGDNLPPGDPSQVWALPERNAGFAPFDPSGASPVDGQYVVWGGDVTDSLASWGAAHGVSITQTATPDAVDLTTNALYTGAAFVPLLALMLALIVLLVVNAGRQVRVSTQKYLNGVSPFRTAAEFAATSLGTVLVPIVVLCLIAIAIVAIRSGVAFVPFYLVGLAHFIVPSIVLVALCAIALTAISWPDASVIARRDQGVGTLGIVAEVTKILAVGTTLVLLPLALSGLLRAEQFRAEADLWKKFDGVVTVNNFNTVPGTPEDTAVGDAFSSLVTEASDAMLVMDWGAAAGVNRETLGEQYDGIVVVNHAYLDRVSIGASAIEDVAPEALPSELSNKLTAGLQLQLRDQEPEGADVFELLQPMSFTEPAVLPVITGRYLDGMVLLERPLMLVVDDLSALSPDFLLAATASSGVLFSDAEEFQSLLAAHDLTDSARGTDYVATLGLLDLQSRQALAAYAAAAVVVLGATLVTCLWTSAQQYVLSRAKRFLPLALSGHGFIAAMRRRLLWEILIVAVLWVASCGVAVATSLASTAALPVTGAAVLAMALSVAFHARAYSTIVRRTLLRRTI